MHYFNHGTTPSISLIFIEASTLFITTLTSTLLIYYIDWPRLLQCTSSLDCETSLSFYVHSHRSGLVNFFLICYLAISLIYLTVRIFSLFSRFRNVLSMGAYYSDVLKVDPRALHKGSVSWADIIDKVIE
jgi:hypothetical protein